MQKAELTAKIARIAQRRSRSRDGARVFDSQRAGLRAGSPNQPGLTLPRTRARTGFNALTLQRFNDSGAPRILNLPSRPRRFAFYVFFRGKFWYRLPRRQPGPALARVRFNVLTFQRFNALTF